MDRRGIGDEGGNAENAVGRAGVGGTLKGKKGLIWLLVAVGIIVLIIMNGGKSSGGMTEEEQRIARVLSAMDGAGQVKVALFYAKEAGSFAGDGAGQPTGAVVVAQGAGSMEVRLNLVRAVRTLLNLEEDAVDVFLMEDKR